ncbi:MAG: tetratricopeptide repeat protein [Planctomycetes bacterium]|nr:tetratricopeptide repeat protein [Planctomycetota bacterium]
MPKRYFNWKLASILLIGFVVLAVTAFGLRKWQRGRMAYASLFEGNAAYETAQWQEAAKHLGRYIVVAGDDVPVLLKYAEAQVNIRPLKRNNLQQAIAVYRRILRIDKTHSEVALKLVEIYLQVGMYGEAELIAGRILQRDIADKDGPAIATQTERSPQLRSMLAIALIGQRKYKEAARELEAIIDDHPDQIAAYKLFGTLIERRPEDFSREPLFWFDEAIKNNPSSSEAYITRAAYYLRVKEKAKAIADLQQAEKHDLSDPLIRLRFASELINANAFDSAEEHLVAVREVDPANQILWQIWAQLAIHLNSNDVIREVADNGLKELSSQPWDFLPVAAGLYIRCDELDRAAECIARLLQNEISPANTAYLQGLLSEKKGQSHEAIGYWRKAIQLGNEPYRVRLAMASAMIRLGDRLSALKQAQILLSQYPDSLQIRLLLARLLSQSGTWAHAAEHARMARRISPDNLDAALLHVHVQMQLIAENKTTADSKAYRDIEGNLSQLDKATGGSGEVKLLQLQLAMLRNDSARAQALIAELQDEHPDQMKPAMAEIEMLRAGNKVQEATSRLQELIKEFPQSVEPVRYLAILMHRQDKNTVSERVVIDALARIETPAERRELALLLAELYTQWDQDDNAYQLLNSIAEELPHDVPLKRRLLVCPQVIDDPHEAQSIIDSIKLLEGNDGWQWRYEQAKLWFVQDSFEILHPQIISILKENLFNDPGNQPSLLLLAAAYEKAGQLSLAVSVYREALNRSPRDLRIIIPAVAALYRAHEYDYADQVLRYAADENLLHPELEKLTLKSHLRRGQLSSASEIMQNLLAKDPENRSICLSLALLKIRQDQFDEAEKLLEKLKIAEPDSRSVAVAQIELNLRQGKNEQAILLCDRVIAESGNAAGYMLRARTLAHIGRTGQAEKDFQQATVLEPDSHVAWTAKSDFYCSMGQLDKAVADIREAMSLSADNLSIQKRAIELFLVSGDKDTVAEGKSILDKALAANPTDVQLRLYKGRILLSEATAPAIEQAVSILKKITTEQPGQGQAWTLLAQTALGRGQTAEAIDTALQGLVYRPNDKSLLLLKARAEAMRAPRLAIPTLRGLLEVYPNDIDVVMRLINAYIEAQQPEKAVELAKTQLESSLDAADVRKIRTALAVGLHKSGDKVQAQEVFNSLTTAVPDDPEPLLAQIRLLKDDKLWPQLRQQASRWCQEHPDETDVPIAIAGGLVENESDQARAIAEDLLRATLERAPDNIPAMNTLATLSRATGDIEESILLYRRIIAIEPENVIAINNLAWTICQEQKDYQQALELATRGLQTAPTYADLIDTRGVSYYQLGQYDNAVADFNKCLELYSAVAPARTASYMHLGRALAKLGQNTQAAENLRKALDLNTEIGGLSSEERADTHNLMEALSQGI